MFSTTNGSDRELEEETALWIYFRGALISNEAPCNALIQFLPKVRVVLDLTRLITRSQSFAALFQLNETIS